jgi:hypothetical protein
MKWVGFLVVENDGERHCLLCIIIFASEQARDFRPRRFSISESTGNARMYSKTLVNTANESPGLSTFKTRNTRALDDTGRR